MDEAQIGWLPELVSALAPGERVRLGAPEPGEGMVSYLVRVARTSRRSKARQIAAGALFPAARDRLEGVVELAVDLLDDPAKFVRYQACRLLAIAHDPATLEPLEAARARGIEVPHDALEGAIRAVRLGERAAFVNPPGWPGRTIWVLQDERWDGEKIVVLGSAADGTERA